MITTIPHKVGNTDYLIKVEDDGDTVIVTATLARTGQRATPFRYSVDGVQAHDFIASGFVNLTGATAVQHLIELAKQDLEENWK